LGGTDGKFRVAGIINGERQAGRDDEGGGALSGEIAIPAFANLQV
jgi:hypothetical protein